MELQFTMVLLLMMIFGSTLPHQASGFTPSSPLEWHNPKSLATTAKMNPKMAGRGSQTCYIVDGKVYCPLMK